MVQPRKEQIKNLKTRHSRVAFNPAPGSAYTDIPDGAINSQVISDTPGGVQEDVPALVISTFPEPFIIFMGAAIDISIDGAAPTTVALALSDTTASKIAYAINTALGISAAFNDNGSLGIISNSVGNDSSITLADNVFGSLAVIGLTAGTYNGASVPTRGVITRSNITFPSIIPINPNPRGGFVPLKDNRGRNIVTDTSSINQIRETTSNEITRRLDIPGGMPIHGRLIRNPVGTTYRLSYYAQMPSEPEVITFNSNFALLDGTDTITFTFDYRIKRITGITTVSIPVTVTFPAFPYTRDQVIDRINDTFQLAAATGGGRAYIIGTISQPFHFSAGDILNIGMDGGALTGVAFNPAVDKTATAVAATINAAVGAIVAGSISTSGYNEYVYIESTVTNGRLSSIELVNRAGNPLERLGFRPGLYRGFFVAEPYGNDEIRIRGLGRGSNQAITVSGLGPSTGTRLGITTGTRWGSDKGEVKVNFPELDFIDPTKTHTAVAIFPEVLEYGEVDPATEGIIEKFNVKILANQWGNGADLLIDGEDTARTDYSRGVKDVGKPVLINPFGQIDNRLISGVSNAEVILSKFVVGDLSPGVAQVDRLSISNIETPAGANPNPASDSMEFDVDPDGDFVPSNRNFAFRIERDGISKTPWQFTETSIPSLDQVFQLSGTTGISSISVPVALIDPNIQASGVETGGLQFLALTNRAGRYTRKFEIETSGDPSPESILQKMNAIWTVTVGDGIGSFGDFNGSDAIHQAITYFNTNVIDVNASQGLRVQCKSGVYLVNIVNGPITIPDGVVCIIEGVTGSEHGLQPQVQIKSDQPEVINFATPISSSLLRLENLEVSTGNATLFTDITVNQQRRIEARNSVFIFTRISIEDGADCYFEQCRFQSSRFADREIIRLEMGDDTIYHGPFRWFDCSFIGGNHHSILTVAASGAAVPLTTINLITFQRCKMDLGSTSDDGFGNLIGNCGVIDVDPNGSSFFNGGEGVQIEKLLFKECDIVANSSTGAGILIHLIPTSNGAAISALTDEFVMFRDVEIDGGRWIASGIDSSYSPFVIAGVWNLSVKNTVLGYPLDSTPIYGEATADLGYWFTGVFGDPPPVSRNWGAFATCAWANTHWENVKFQNLVQRSNNGDLFIRYNQLTMMNIYMNNYKNGGTGSGVGPIQRIRFRPTSEDNTLNGHVKNLIIHAGEVGAASGTDWADQAIIYYEPSIANFTFDGVRIGEFLVSATPPVPTGAEGFIIPLVSIGGLYTGSSNTTKNLTINNCVIKEVENGIFVASSEPGQHTEGKIINNHVYSCSGQGIRLHQIGNGGTFHFIVSNNIIHNNGDYGVLVQAELWDHIAAECSIIMTDNHIHDNNGSAAADQIRIRAASSSTSVTQYPRGVCANNNCWGAGSPGCIKINHTDNATPSNEIALPAAGSYGLTVYMRGIETGHSITSTIGYVFVPADHMIRNVAILTTP